MNNKIASNYSDLNSKISDTDTNLRAALKQAKDDLNDTITSTKTELQNSISGVISDLAVTNSNLESTNAALAGTNKAVTALTNRVTVNEGNITSLNEKISEMGTKYDDAIQKLWTQVNQNTSDIASLTSRLNAFIASADGHFKVDMIPGFTIAADAWKASGSNVTYTVTNGYLKGCTVMDVDYASQYDISPTYSVDSSSGKLTITIPANQKAAITVADVMCYHQVSDDAAASGHKVTDESKNTYSNLD